MGSRPAPKCKCEPHVTINAAKISKVVRSGKRDGGRLQSEEHNDESIKLEESRIERIQLGERVSDRLHSHPSSQSHRHPDLAALGLGSGGAAARIFTSVPRSDGL